MLQKPVNTVEDQVPSLVHGGRFGPARGAGRAISDGRAYREWLLLQMECGQRGDLQDQKKGTNEDAGVGW